MSHKSVTVITKITLMKAEAEQAIMDYAKVAYANSITFEPDGRVVIEQRSYPGEAVADTEAKPEPAP